MKKGTIYKNLWAGYESYFVYIEDNYFTKGIADVIWIGNIDGKWKIDTNAQYIKREIEKDSEHYPIVGKLNPEEIDSMIINLILSKVSLRGQNN